MSETRKELVLLVVGAMIAAGSSQLTTFVQARNERAKLLLEKQIGIVREYSELLNQTVFSMQESLSDALVLIESMQSETREGRLPAPAQFDQLGKVNQSLSASVTKLQSSLKLQKIMVVAIFGDKSDAEPGFRTLGTTTGGTIGQSVAAISAARDTKSKLASTQKLLDVLEERYKLLDKQLVEIANEENALVFKYANQLGS